MAEVEVKESEAPHSVSDLLEVAKSVKDEERERKRREKLKKKLLKEAEKTNKKGVCYLSRIPPKMDPLKIRQLLSPYGEIKRIYLAPEGQFLFSIFYFQFFIFVFAGFGSCS